MNAADPGAVVRCWYCSAEVPDAGDDTPCPSCGRTPRQQSAWVPTRRAGEEPAASGGGGGALTLAIASMLLCVVNFQVSIFGLVLLGWGAIPAIIALSLTNDPGENGMMRAARIVATVGLIINIIAFALGALMSVAGP